MNSKLVINGVREALRSWSVAVCGVLFSMVATGCLDSSSDSDPPPIQAETQDVTEVMRPRVVMLNADTAAIVYVQSVRHLQSLDRVDELFTSRHLLSTGASTLLARADVDRFSPHTLSAAGNGLAITLSSTRDTTGCVISMADTVSCTVLDPNPSSVVAAVPGDAGESVVLYGQEPLQQRTYNQFGWSPTRTVPESSGIHSLDDVRSMARGVDGVMFMAANRRQELVAARANPSSTWQAFESLGTVDMDPQIALHPEAQMAFPVVVWGNAEGVAFSVGLATGGWSPAAIIPGSELGTHPTVTMWPNGDVIAIWRGPFVESVMAARRINEAWEQAVVVSGNAISIMDRRIQVSLDRHGNAIAMWRVDTIDQLPSLRSASYLAGVGWQPETTVGTLAVAASEGNFDVAMTPEGRAVAVWVRPAGGDQPGSRLAIAEVGQFALALTAQRHTFGGEPIAVTVRFARAPTQATTLSVSTTLPAASVTLPASVPVAANQGEVTFSVPSIAVSDFVSGRLEVTYGNATSSQPVTLMPEPSAIALTVAPTTVLGGERATINLQLTPAYPVGLDAQLESNNAVAPVPASVSLNSNAIVRLTTATTTAAQTATFTARVRNRIGTASLQVNPTALGQSVLTVSVNGMGTVTSTPAGISNCSQTCTASYPIGTPVTLTATPMPASNFKFFAWEGDADCSEGKLTMMTARRCTAIFLPMVPPYPDGEGWTYLGRPLIGLNTVNPSPALALDGLAPVVAFVTSAYYQSAVPQLSVMRLGGGTFHVLGRQSTLNVNSALAASEPAIVTTSNGLPYVAWIEGSGAQQNLYVSRLSYGTNWETLGPLNYVAGSRASSPSIALDAELRPMVAWIENGAVKFKRFDGTAWVQSPSGEGPASAGADRVRLSAVEAIVGNATPAIAWTQGGGMNRALKVVSDFAFTPLATQVNVASLAPLTEFSVLSLSGSVYVTWGDGDTPFTIRSQHWNGNAWVDVESNQVVNNNPNRLVSIAMPRNSLDVAHLWHSNTVDTSDLGVSDGRAGGWLPSAPFFGGTRGSIGPIAVELANAQSPIVAYVTRNASNEYLWWVIRYYRP